MPTPRQRLLLMGRHIAYENKIRNMFSGSLLAYWPLWEAGGLVARDISGNGRNGAYSATGVTYGNSGIGDGKTSVLLDGSAGLVNVFSASLASAFSATEGTLSLFATKTAWDNATTKSFLAFSADASNRIYLRKGATENQISFAFIANATTYGVSKLITNLNFNNYGITWSKTNNRIRFFVNGCLYHEFAYAETWAGALTTAALGSAAATPSLPFDGKQAHGFIASREASLAEMFNVATVNIPPIKITTLGDSITNATSAGNNWIDLVSSGYGYAGDLNYAYPGSTIIHGGTYPDMADQVLSAASDNANIIIIALGTNDDNAGNMTTLQAEVEAGIIALKASNPNATIYYMNLLPRWTNTGGLTEIDKGNIRTAIAAACTAQSITCWDTYTTPWITAGDTSDGTHPILAGHQKICVEVLARL